MNVKEVSLKFLNELQDYINSLSNSEKLNSLEEKRKSILYHDELYYGKCQPVIEDSMYDYLVREYKKSYKEFKDSIDNIYVKINEHKTNMDKDIEKLPEFKIFLNSLNGLENKIKELELKVGTSISEVVYKKEKHEFPMISLDNTYNLKEISDFLEDILHEITSSSIFKDEDKKDLSFIIEEKIDGLSCDLLFKNGKLVRALTRGDGYEGEVITHKILDMENVPKEINFEEYPVHVRGEIVLKYENWDKLKYKDLEYKNPRNAAAGIIRMKSNELNGYLSFIGYEVIIEHPSEELFFKTHKDKIDFLRVLGKNFGFEMPNSYCLDLKDYIFKSFDEEIKIKIQDIISKEETKVNRKENDYPTDGLVFKLNPTKFYRYLGSTAKFPKYNIAYKFKDLEYVSIVKDIVWQVGRTGKLTPVVEIEPVDIEGSTITRATAHNLEQMVRLGNIAKGKDVVIVKSAMVIPKILRVVDYPIDSVVCDPLDLSKIDYPKKCPSCGSTLVIEGPDLICKNINCRDKNIQKITFFCGRNYMNIEGLSIGIVTNLYDKGLLRKIEDIYNLYMFKNELIKIPGFGLKSITKLLENIERSKNNEPYRLIAGLGYPNIGLVMSKDIMNHFDNDLNVLASKTKEDIIKSNISNIGDVVINNIEELLNDMNKILELCKKYNIKTKSDNSRSNNSNILNGKTFVFTGKMIESSRKTYEDKVKLNGGNVSSSVNRNTTYLIIGENPTERKVTLAKMMGKPIFTEQMFLDYMENLNKN